MNTRYYKVLQKLQKVPRYYFANLDGNIIRKLQKFQRDLYLNTRYKYYESYKKFQRITMPIIII